MDLGEKYSKLTPAAPWPGGPVFTAEGPGGKKFFVRGAAGAEAGAAPFLSHPALPVYVETVWAPRDGEEKKFLVYEHFAGESIASVIAGGGAFTEIEALNLGYETARALKYLHGLSPRVAHGAVSTASVFRSGARVFLCGCSAARDTRADLEGLAGLMRAFAAVPRGGGFSPEYSDLLEALGRPDIEAGQALKLIESLGTRPLFRVKEPALKPKKGGLPLYSWPLAAAVLFLAFFLAFKFRMDYWPQLRARRNISLATELARDFPCSLVPAPASRSGSGGNLVFNPGLEGPCGWHAYGGFKRSMIKKGNPHSGVYYFHVADAEDGIYQDVDISRYAGRIAAGGCRVYFSGYLRADGWGRDGMPYLYGYAMRSEDDYTYLGGFQPVGSRIWTLASYEWPLPAGVNKVRVSLQASSYKGSILSKKAFFDDISVEINCL
ncbi:MAG: hypothetical protein HY550_05555 [Elusimicrobia bacterium]|nr:hypothetical protein [Elusimicrobiota bacterium]